MNAFLKGGCCASGVGFIGYFFYKQSLLSGDLTIDQIKTTVKNGFLGFSPTGCSQHVIGGVSWLYCFMMPLASFLSCGVRDLVMQKSLKNGVPSLCGSLFLAPLLMNGISRLFGNFSLNPFLRVDQSGQVVNLLNPYKDESCGGSRKCVLLFPGC